MTPGRWQDGGDRATRDKASAAEASRMEETSLGDFVGGEEPADVESDSVSEAESTTDEPVREEGRAGHDDAAIAPPRATSLWTPAGGSCERCGEGARRRWRDGEAVVCGDCVDW